MKTLVEQLCAFSGNDGDGNDSNPPTVHDAKVNAAKSEETLDRNSRAMGTTVLEKDAMEREIKHVRMTADEECDVERVATPARRKNATWSKWGDAPGLKFLKNGNMRSSM